MTVQEPTIDFQLQGQLRGFFFNPARPEGLQFAAGPPRPLNVRAAPAKPEVDAFGTGQGLECRVYTSTLVAAPLRSFVEQLINRKFEPSGDALIKTSIKLPLIQGGEVRIDEHGHIADGFAVPYELYPSSLQSVCDDAFRELYDALARFVKLLRWQQEIDAPHNVFDFGPALYWRVIEGPYYFVALKRRGSVTFRSPVGISWSDEDQQEFAALWAQSSAEEPLAHELLREAKVALDGSPRSALLLTATALETGVKTHVSKLVPDAGWLLSELPSPPIHLMLRKFIPMLHDERRTGLVGWAKLKPLFNDAETLGKYRNKLTHTGQMPAEALSALPSLMSVVTDLLYVLDVLEGHLWAKECVTRRTRVLLGWPKPRHQRFFVTTL